MNSKDMAIGYALGYNDGLGKSSGESSGDSGETNKWVRPADWPAMPEPADNQIVILTSTRWNRYPSELFYLYAYRSGETTTTFSATTSAFVDWGDGHSETIELSDTKNKVELFHDFYDNATDEAEGWHGGSTLANGDHIFVITITIPDNAYMGPIGGNFFPLEAYIGKNVKFHNIIKASYSQTLEHIKFFDWQPTENDCSNSIGMLNNCTALQCVTTTTPWTYLPKYAFRYCYLLNENGIDLSECTKIDNSALSYTGISMLNAPKLETLCAYGCYNCFGLKEVNAPNLKTVENNAFSSCYNIESIIHAEDWTYTASNFKNNFYRWYDNPERPEAIS